MSIIKSLIKGYKVGRAIVKLTTDYYDNHPKHDDPADCIAYTNLYKANVGAQFAKVKDDPWANAMLGETVRRGRNAWEKKNPDHPENRKNVKSNGKPIIKLVDADLLFSTDSEGNPPTPEQIEERVQSIFLNEQHKEEESK